jgi:hypothetical protein
MPTFADVVDATAQLSADEQQRLPRILRRRIAERNRARLACDVAEAILLLTVGTHDEVY